MRRVNIAQLKARLSEYLRAVQDGETIRVLDRQKEVATISGISTVAGTRIARALVEQGCAEWGGGKPVITPLVLRKKQSALADAVLEDRG